MRSQAAALPRMLTRCAAAYAEGNTRLAESLFPAVHAEVLPLVKRVVNQHLDKPEDKEDAEQVALTLIWRDAKRGKECVVENVARQAAIDVWRKSPVMGNLRSVPEDMRSAVGNPEDILELEVEDNLTGKQIIVPTDRCELESDELDADTNKGIV